MAINPDDLKLRTGNFKISFGVRSQISLDWEVYHSVLKEVVDSGTHSGSLAKLDDAVRVEAELQRKAIQSLNEIRERHAPRLEGLSAHDLSLVLDGWMVDGEGLDHPICGHVDARPQGLVETARAVLGAIPPPPAWTWAETREEKLWVRCIPVSGAKEYQVYDGDVLLGTVPDHTWNSLPNLPSGMVRIAAVVGGKVGVPSFRISPSRKVSDLRNLEPVVLEAMGMISEPSKAARLVSWLKGA